MSTPTYDEIVAAYKIACAGGREPNLIVIRPLRKTRLLRRRLGRYVRRGLIDKKDCVEVYSKRGVWQGVLIV